VPKSGPFKNEGIHEHLVGMRPDQMRTENSPALGFDERLVTVHGFADAPGSVPV
jgi:hypothetical protein